MDGHFVPNITIGAPVVAAIRKRTSTPLDVHLMIESPERYINDFARGRGRHHHRPRGSLPPPAPRHPDDPGSGARPGVSLNPATPIGSLEHVLADVDLVLMMTVNPGFGGQAFIPHLLGKVSALRRRLDELHLPRSLKSMAG